MKVTAWNEAGDPTELYCVLKMPMFFSNRDLHIKLQKTIIRDGLALYTSSSISKPEYPSPSGTLRASIFAYSFIKEVEEGMHCVEFSNADLKGYIPATLLNMAIGSVTAKEYCEMGDKLKKIKEENGF